MINVRDRAALGHIVEHGNDWQIYRAKTLLAGEVPGSRAVNLPVGWAKGQAPDGGMLRPYDEKSKVSSVGATSGMLVAMSFFGLGETPEGKRAIEYAWRMQLPDGRWTEDPTPESTPPPPWFTPGDIAVDLWETANMAAGLAALGFVHDPRLSKAVVWAEGYVQPDGDFPGYIHTTYGMASSWYRLGDAEAAQRHLRRALDFLATDPDIHDLNWGLSLFWAGRIPAEHETVCAYLDILVEKQLSEGLWPTIYTGSEAHFALEALELLRVYGRR